MVHDLGIHDEQKRMNGQPRSNTTLNFFKVWAMKNNLQGHKCSYREKFLTCGPFEMYNESSQFYLYWTRIETLHFLNRNLTNLTQTHYLEKYRHWFDMICFYQDRYWQRYKWLNKCKVSIFVQYMSHAMNKPVQCTFLYASSRGADQPTHPCSLIRTFTVHFVKSIFSIQ